MSRLALPSSFRILRSLIHFHHEPPSRQVLYSYKTFIQDKGPALQNSNPNEKRNPCQTKNVSGSDKYYGVNQIKWEEPSTGKHSDWIEVDMQCILCTMSKTEGSKVSSRREQAWLTDCKSQGGNGTEVQNGKQPSSHIALLYSLSLLERECTSSPHWETDSSWTIFYSLPVSPLVMHIFTYVQSILSPRVIMGSGHTWP